MRLTAVEGVQKPELHFLIWWKEEGVISPRSDTLDARDIKARRVIEHTYVRSYAAHSGVAPQGAHERLIPLGDFEIVANAGHIGGRLNLRDNVGYILRRA